MRSETAIFAGGCFWCVEADFEKLPGVTNAVSGYIGGHVVHPSYDQVSAGVTGHIEAVRITYDPSRVSYEQLLDYFWLQIDPTVDDRQFCDVGLQYRSAIFYLNDAQRKVAEASKHALEQSGRLRHVSPPVKVDSKSYPPEFQLEAVRNAEKEAVRYAKDHPSGKVLTNILPATTFYLAEEYHQDYYKKNPIRYRLYRTQCGRDARLKHVWGKARH
ncbi:MAG: peptide-methionine (S)-S-oxide reductase [Oxalobacter sp.]|nr:MAG: peptide-methionine (S)-S-oxide reductase [Oxalobacter sp.]